MKTIEGNQTATPLETVAAARIESRYDVDWLRVIAVLSVLALHSAVIFSFGQFIVQHTQHTLTMDTLVTFFSIWVIPLLFVLAGAWYVFVGTGHSSHVHPAADAHAPS